MTSLVSHSTGVAGDVLLEYRHNERELVVANDNRPYLPTAATITTEYLRPAVVFALLWLAGLLAYEWFVRLYDAIAMAQWSKLT